MISTIASVGRNLVSLFGFIIILICTISGYYEYGIFHYVNYSMDERIIGLAFGVFVGFILAGFLLGPIAALYDILDNLKEISNKMNIYNGEKSKNTSEDQNISSKNDKRYFVHQSLYNKDNS